MADLLHVLVAAGLAQLDAQAVVHLVDGGHAWNLTPDAVLQDARRGWWTNTAALGRAAGDALPPEFQRLLDAPAVGVDLKAELDPAAFADLATVGPLLSPWGYAALARCVDPLLPPDWPDTAFADLGTIVKAYTQLEREPDAADALALLGAFLDQVVASD